MRCMQYVAFLDDANNFSSCAKICTYELPGCHQQIPNNDAIQKGLLGSILMKTRYKQALWTFPTVNNQVPHILYLSCSVLMRGTLHCFAWCFWKRPVKFFRVILVAKVVFFLPPFRDTTLSDAKRMWYGPVATCLCTQDHFFFSSWHASELSASLQPALPC